jgi:ABC-type glycerol-3-phosphate transport system substrate-binding protein
VRYAIPLLLAAGALTLAGCGGKSASPTTTTATTAPTTTEAATTTTTAATTTAATTTAAATTAAGPVTIRVVVKGGKPVGGIQRATVKKGQKVAIVVHSDVADEVHVHGYDLHKDVDAGGTVRIVFPATITGVFEAELESRKLQIVELTVE